MSPANETAIASAATGAGAAAAVQPAIAVVMSRTFRMIGSNRSLVHMDGADRANEKPLYIRAALYGTRTVWIDDTSAHFRYGRPRCASPMNITSCAARSATSCRKTSTPTASGGSAKVPFLLTKL